MKCEQDLKHMKHDVETVDLDVTTVEEVETVAKNVVDDFETIRECTKNRQPVCDVDLTVCDMQRQRCSTHQFDLLCISTRKSWGKPNQNITRFTLVS